MYQLGAYQLGHVHCTGWAEVRRIRISFKISKLAGNLPRPC